MFKRVPFKKEHAIPLLEQKINIRAKDEMSLSNLKELEMSDSHTAFWDNEVLCCAGILKMWEGRGFLWVIFNEKSKYNFLPIFRATQKSIQESVYNRIEMTIPYEMEFSKRRAEMLGFKLECKRARKFFPNGGDATLYAWVRE